MSSSETVTALEQPTTFAGLSTRVEAAIEKAYWCFDARHKGMPPYGQAGPQSERDAFKWAVRDMLLGLRHE